MNKNHSEEIDVVIKQYFDGIYYGNVDLLQKVFHPQALLSGEVNGQPYFKTVPEYLDIVKNRKSPYALGEAFQMKVRSIEQTGAVAYARLFSPMLGFKYYDFIALRKTDVGWMIMNKLFTHNEEFSD